MLRITIELDYGDEIGRKMDSLVREMLIYDFLPEDPVAPCMEVMSRLADKERDLARVITIEAVHALRDPGDNEDRDQPDVDPDSSFDSTATLAPARPNKTSRNREEMMEAEQTHADNIDGCCRRICESMLERINSIVELLLKSYFSRECQ
jgi:condensin complex subunit 3